MVKLALHPRACYLTHTFNSADALEYTHLHFPVSFETWPSIYKLIELYITHICSTSILYITHIYSTLSKFFFFTLLYLPLLCAPSWPQFSDLPSSISPSSLLPTLLIPLFTIYHVFIHCIPCVHQDPLWPWPSTLSVLNHSHSLNSPALPELQNPDNWVLIVKGSTWWLCLVNTGPHLAGHKLLHKYPRHCRRCSFVLFHGGGPTGEKNKTWGNKKGYIKLLYNSVHLIS